MKPFQTAKLIGATVALFLASYSVLLVAQTQPLQVEPKQSFEAAALVLPDAPVPQTGVATPEAPTSTSGAQSSSTSTQPRTASTPPPTPPAETKQQEHDEAERELKVQEKQRLLGVMPQFQVVMGGSAVPLSGGEKWRLALHSAIDPFYIGWAFVVGGGLGEAEDSDTGFGWGAKGYFWRVGATYADNVNGALIGNALLPQILHQDPRYFRKGSGSIKSRFVYAALSTVICHGDNGKNQFNTSNVLGNFLSGAISNAYYPADDRGFGHTLETGADVTLFGALGGQLLEFGPDLAGLMHRHKHQSVPGPTPVAPSPAP